MRGFLKFRTICLLSKWKYCAGVVGCPTNMFTVSPSTPSSVLSHIWGRRENVQIIAFNHNDICSPKVSMRKDFPPLQNILEGKFTAYEELTEERYDGSSICLSPHI